LDMFSTNRVFRRTIGPIKAEVWLIGRTAAFMASLVHLRALVFPSSPWVWVLIGSCDAIGESLHRRQPGKK
jgi:hypothetical protein